jgi:tight adherence protein B
MSGSALMIFLAMVFAAVFFLSQGVVIPVFGEGSKVRKRLKERLQEIDSASSQESFASLLRANYLNGLSPMERWLESLPGMEGLARKIDQSGHKLLAYKLVFLSLVLSGVLAFVGWTLTRSVTWTPLCGLIGLGLPYFKISRDRNNRIARFEEQLPDAIDSMKRALRAGHPFAASIKLVAEDMDDPVAREFELTFADINYGNDLRRAMLGLLQRVPSLTVMALVTAVLVQKETGGNLAEILDQISNVIRGRFRFFRKVKTLSAEGRLSAWILALVPFILFAVITVTTPDYLPVLLEDPVGRKMIGGGFILGVVGIYWIRRIIRIEV